MQFNLFEDAGGKHEAASNLPEGFLYRPELISPADEAAILARVRELPFRDFQFHGYTGKRRVVSFGFVCRLLVVATLIATVPCLGVGGRGA